MSRLADMLHSEYERGVEDGMKQAVEYGQWISVDERLPEKSSTFVLGLTAPGTWSVGRNCFVVDYVKPLHEKGFFVMPLGYDSETLNITHWMPLPDYPDFSEDDET